MVYLDYSATTPVLPEVLDSYNKVTEEYFGNPNSLHSLGVKAHELLESANKQVSELLNIKEDEFFYTSGATESNNLAIIGAALTYKRYGNRILVSTMEHPSIYGICKHLEKLGFIIDYVNVTNEGVIDFDDLKNKVTKDTILVSICAVNSETGVRQPLKMIRQIIKKENMGTIFHSDMTQAIGKVSVNMHDVDLASMSSHKIFGPKGIGFLYKSSMVKITPLIYGSGKTNDLKPGTPPLPLIAALSKAVRLANDGLEKKERFVTLLNDKIVNALSKYPNIKINKTKYSIPQILNISVMDVMPEVLVHALEKYEIYVSTNTACSSGDISNSIIAIYNDINRAKHTIRISLSYVSTTEEVNKFIEVFKSVYENLSNLR